MNFYSLKKLINYTFIGLACVFVVNIFFWLLAAYGTYSGTYNISEGAVYLFHFIFNFDHEYNLPSLIAFLLLLDSAIFIYLIARLKFGRKYLNVYYLMALMFFLMAIDELFFLHERLHSAIEHYEGFLIYGWLFPGMVIAAIAAIFFMRFVGRIPSVYRKKLTWAGILYVFSALGLELVSFIYSTTMSNDFFFKKILGTSEEFLEFVAIFMFIKIFLDYYQTLKIEQIKKSPVQ